MEVFIAIRRSCSPIAHEVRFVADGVFARLFGCLTIRVNSLHGQAILEPRDRVVVEGVAEDGTIEAIRIAGASAFALGVQLLISAET
jgi:putative glutamine amidotransferase